MENKVICQKRLTPIYLPPAKLFKKMIELITHLKISGMMEKEARSQGQLI